ncbi:MAG: peptide/nickel transport system ATP-binding protein, partial [Chloroflexota bacterium]|nr:peptide/nickel transport system ATP-binding protein [Chloroflexota bacterium]
GEQMLETLRFHPDRKVQAVHARDRMLALMQEVQLPTPAAIARRYPFQLSGGMKQRISIAMALMCEPDLLIADEPTTALDVTIQAQILDLLRDLKSKMDAAIILITHDLGIVAEMCQRVAVMYAGRIVEEASVEEIFAYPKHPYTIGLIGSVPILGVVKDKLEVIPGSVPNLVNLPLGCQFAPRCLARVEHNLEICTQQEPELQLAAPQHKVRCWLYQ